MDFTTPPKNEAHMEGGSLNTAKHTAIERKNVTRSTKKHAHTSFAMEMKDSLAEGKPPKVNTSEDQMHLKARWHSATKEVTYHTLDLSKVGWKGYSTFDKGKVHKKLNAQYKFESPLDPKQVDKYLARHLRSSRAVWKTHWQKHGDNKRHHNCPKMAWEKLIQWWPTVACMKEATCMASKRSLVQKSSNSRQKALVDRMDEEVRDTMIALYATVVVYCRRMRIRRAH